jgi:hypothetical protein
MILRTNSARCVVEKVDASILVRKTFVGTPETVVI